MKYTPLFRIWHWFNALVVLGLLATVFLRKTFLSWRTNSEILMTKLSEIGVEITTEQAKMLAKAVRAGMWEWHIILGYALVFSLLLRIYLYFKDNSHKKDFSSLGLHKKGVTSLYYLVYATLFFMAGTGLVIHFYQDLGLSKDLAHSIKDIHELTFNILMIFVPLHLAGLFIAENRDEKGVVSSMINGKGMKSF